MGRRAFLLFAVLLLLTGCSKPKRSDPKAEIVAETVRHIEQVGPALARLGKLSELTPPTEMMANLRLVARDLNEWRRGYRTLRAKMLARNVSSAQRAEVNRRYKVAMEDVRLKFDQAERRVTRRGDVHLFHADLVRVREIVREL